ncbi:SpoIIIAH-like family protein [Virgibacillus halodenitrificans]|uniref:SpoIIIAH-like family protein n=1 Tax=Virgibacillus halodenitrificans TaxID=1482 RepID=A0AAC9J0C9_VIRHA|nr:SpoIIIAH-like family protein [Virgibacillus halodenitrificans]APC48333.1 stage III sporulation protein AH [Virgibacillus halodenitrificans]MBD1222718.1 SpoIIIAH-like family protein [Virgibacillus halodenitrificans]MCJ0930898.1 SpoIIIAH-like family protein [Virgibacillus halodenitrificans]MEC2158399.1 SpoIIIAH-like family protein [Virgibacillus halodenitrificans]MYL47207.1 SpoIIIAH-like family protein [Virgibacillus halodenitrificans]
MLKKQTVWLLTMLSLMIVLSVYYMTSPASEDLAYINDGQDQEEAVPTDSQETEGEAEVEGISNMGEDELFTTIRMELEDERSMKKDRLKDIVASSSASADEKDQALRDIDVIEDVSTKESILEETILGSEKYEDVLVRSEDDKVHVHVKVDTLSSTEVVNIMQMVRDEFGEVPVDVNFQPKASE